MKKKNLHALSGLLFLSLLAGSASFSVSVLANSGPVSTPREYESLAIQNAPAYDTADARTYIDGMPEVRA